MARKAFYGKKTGVVSTMRYTNASGVTIPAGTPILVGTIVGILLEDLANGATGVIDCDNEYDIVCEAATTCVTGDEIWYNPATGYAINGAPYGVSAAFFVGYATKARTSADAALLSVRPNFGAGADDNSISITNTALADAAATLTPAQLLGGLITITPTTGRTLTLPTADTLIAAMKRAGVKKSVKFTIKNLAAATHNITVAASSSITNGGPAADLSIAAAGTASYVIVVTNVTADSEAAVLYKVST